MDTKKILPTAERKSWRGGGRLSREIVVGGLPPTTRPDFEIARVLREFKAVPTALASRSPAPAAAELTRSAGVQTAPVRKGNLHRYRKQFDNHSLIID
ncbi:hypothetical protein Lpp14_01879 [Lacticaseibacillus paracasei subsp. paracasei Lpp14]|uniref:Uncharacterized protein n=1 Tax=Lacticaseibacillus paracasei subsp. paracasei Lpp14 TaxID=1256204 RepID=A0A829H1Q6_LACPA|nr:hypothetical protein Lpp14_01879 [Lacticaseibacillus paracasei subsp. paracasei Lpp14]